MERELLGFEGAIELDAEKIADLYRDCHFGGLARVAALLGMDVDVVGAEGPWLKLADGYRYFFRQTGNALDMHHR